MKTTNTTATLLEADGTWSLRFERRFAHPIEKVWRAVSEPQHRNVWFPQQIEGDLVPGGELRFSGDPNMPDMTFDGRCLAIDPPRLLEILWGVDVLRMELAEDADGTRLTFTSRLGDKGHAALTGSGWHHCLDVLESQVDGTPRPQLDDAGWDALRAEYHAIVGD